MKRKVVKIDEDKCDGCGLCVPSCAEGAIVIVDGKARLVADNLCDGLGNCLGKCPKDAITVEEREADEFDEDAVVQHKHRLAAHNAPRSFAQALHGGGGCPGTRMRTFRKPAAPSEAPATGAAQSQLGHWPVQLSLVPPQGAIWQDADVLIAADCVPFAMADFHGRLLAGKSLAIGCPKLDDVETYVEKLTYIFANNPIRSVTVAHMEVPCCFGLQHAVEQALEAAGRTDIELHEVEVAVDGTATVKS
ncbi:MAG: 4Fe-4S binding protein [Planctomycetaceae bacterium]|nr:4Fe-4S binding protein [Planctomycetaceae bacterium]